MEKLLHEMHTWMNAYMRSFRTNDPEVMRGIQLKEIHTGYVTAHARALAKHLGCYAHDMAIAEIIGLFTMWDAFASMPAIGRSMMLRRRIMRNSASRCSQRRISSHR